MNIARLASFAACLVGCAAHPAEVANTNVPSLAETSGTGCADVYLLNPFAGWGPAHDPVREVSFAVDANPIKTKDGKLFGRDWGAFRVCGESVTLKFRGISRGFSEKGPFVGAIDVQPTLSLQGRKAVYFEMGNRWKEIDETRATKIKAEIEERPGVRPNTGWEWVDRRDLYYGPHCQQKSERCP
jgi:hypothetical protein